MRRVVAAALVLTSLACGGDMSSMQPQPLPADKVDYAGHWSSGTGVELTITPDGMVDWQRHDGTTDSSIAAPITEWTDSGFKAGIGFLTTEFKVDSPPADEGGTWKMTVEGIPMTREEEQPLVFPG